MMKVIFLIYLLGSVSSAPQAGSSSFDCSSFLLQGQNEDLISAVLSQDVPVVKYLLNKGADINAKDTSSDQETPLMYAAWMGNLEMVDLLIRLGADVNYKDDKGTTALAMAAFNGNADVVEHLIAHQADANAKNNAGQTPLFFAKANNRARVVEILESTTVNNNEQAQDEISGHGGITIIGRLANEES